MPRCERDAGAPWACRPEPISTQPHARRSRRHTAPAAPTWCLSRRSLAHHHADRPPNRPQQHSHAITSCGLGSAGSDSDGSGIRAQPAATAASEQARCASAPWACSRPEPSAQPHARRSRRHTAPAAPTWCLSRRSSLAHHQADRPPNRPQQHSHAITSCGLGSGGADCDGSGMRAQPAATAAS